MNTETEIMESSGNVFLDLGFSPDEAVLLGLRAELMAELRLWIQSQGWTQTEAAQRLKISRSRASDLMCGKWEQFSLDMLITLAVRAGKRVELGLVA